MSGIEELRVWLGNISARAAGSTVLIVGTYLDKVTEKVRKRLGIVGEGAAGCNNCKTGKRQKVEKKR